MKIKDRKPCRIQPVLVLATWQKARNVQRVKEVDFSWRLGVLLGS